MLIFISYARNDNLKPPDARPGEERYGFVTTLLRRTEAYLTDAGVAAQVQFFIDTREIPDDAQFDELIHAQIAKADVFLAVLSANWIQRPWCRKELELFAQRFAGEEECKSRCVVVDKREVESSDIPALLQGQNRVRFFERDKDQLGGIFEYFKFDEGPRRGFNDAVDRLADIIERRVRESRGVPTMSGAAEADAPSRRVFVAKPAPDMDKRYASLVEELQRQHFTVVPDPKQGFDGEMAAQEISVMLDDALRDAEISIHLLGKSRGFVPADSDQSIVELQLARAASRRSLRVTNGAGVPFQRLLWAPIDLIVDDAVVEHDRDSQAVCDRVTQRIDGDSVFGEDFTKFKLSVADRLMATAPTSSVASLPEGANVYLQFQPQDEKYAANVKKALEAKNLDVDWQRQAGPDATLAHHKFLQECDAVVVCWADGFDTRALSPFAETENPRIWGRDRDFACRTLVVGPPENVPGKTMALGLAGKKKDEPDLVLNLIESGTNPPPEKFDPLVAATKHQAEQRSAT